MKCAKTIMLTLILIIVVFALLTTGCRANIESGSNNSKKQTTSNTNWYIAKDSDFAYHSMDCDSVTGDIIYGYYYIGQTENPNIMLPDTIDGKPLTSYAFMFGQDYPDSFHSSFYGYKGKIAVANHPSTSVTDLQGMFLVDENLTSIDLSSLSTAKVTNMVGMFDHCSSLTSVNVTKFDTSNVKDMGSMFDDCEDLASLNIKNFNTSNVTDMSNMFSDCHIESLDLSGFNTSKVTSMDGMFCSCTKLNTLNLSGFNTSKVIDMSNMFAGVSSVETLDLSSFTSDSNPVLQNMFSGVGDGAENKVVDLKSFDTSSLMKKGNINSAFDDSSKNIKAIFKSIKDVENFSIKSGGYSIKSQGGIGSQNKPYGGDFQGTASLN